MRNWLYRGLIDPDPSFFVMLIIFPVLLGLAIGAHALGIW